jgi:predicted NAD/FAD-binding protein
LQKRIAVIGSGISGLVSANLLSKNYDVTLFEANDYLGGHTHTVDVDWQGQNFAIDTGFIVFNKKTYPNFCKLLTSLAVPIQASEMSFSFSSSTMGLEYNGNRLNTLFADRANLFKPSFYKMLMDITQFNRQAEAYLTQTSEDCSVREFLQWRQYSSQFTKAYFLPMAAAIWSVKPAQIYETSARFIFSFFDNHGLLNVVNRPPWYVIAGGSRNYIAPLTKPFSQNIVTRAKVENIRTQQNQVILHVQGEDVVFDAVVIATHSDQALQMLAQPTPEQQEILAAITYNDNDVVLHYDTSVLPKKRLAWASWNYKDTPADNVGLTYYMNRLQNLTAPVDFCVSVNLTESIQADKILHRFRYAHPCFTRQAIKAQLRHAEINGQQNIYFCGAYWGYGFHEDGVKSAIDACASLGVL